MLFIDPGVSYSITVWSAVEVNTGLCCASAPAIKPLLRKTLPTIFGPLSDIPSHSNTTSNSRGKSIHRLSSIFPQRRSNGELIEVYSQLDREAVPSHT